MMELTPGQEAVLSNIRENGWGAAECRQAALVAGDERMRKPGATDEEVAAIVAFWIECAWQCERGEADWL